MVENLQLSGQPLRRGIPSEKLKEWSDRYGATTRTVRRWLADGEEVGDPCPLDDPLAFKEWWAQHKTWRVPDSVLAAAKDLEPKAQMPVIPVESIDLSEYNLNEGAAVVQARALVAVVYSQLERAYRLGGEVDGLLKKHEKALDALRKAEASEREAAKQRGLLIRKDVVEKDASSAVRMLKSMRDNMVRLVLEQIPDLSDELKAKVGTAIERVRSQEELIFRNLTNVSEQHPA